jgi:adenylyl cyclase-associated protein
LSYPSELSLTQINHTATLDSILKVVLDIQARVSAWEAGGAGAGAGGGGAGESTEVTISPAVKAYDEFIGAFVTPLVASSKVLGPEGEKIGDFLEKGFAKFSREFIFMASQNKKPQKSTDLNAWKEELTALVKAVGAFKDNRSAFANLMSALNEAVQCLSWLFVEGATAPFIENFLDGTLFWSNKVLVAEKKKGEEGVKYVTWCNQFKDLLQNLVKYAKANCTTGMVWNNKGATTYSKGGAPAPSAPSTSTSAPAPSVSAPVVAEAPKPVVAKADIFAGIQSIDQSSGKTAGLKKVDKSEMTHKNEALRASGVVKSSGPAKKEAAAKPAVLVLNASKWQCEYQVETCEITITDSKQDVYIFGCVGATIIIKGKFKSLAVDGCKKTAVVLDSVISTVEVVNCKSQKIQVLGNAPACAVDKTDGFQIYLSKDSHTTQIVTSKCSDMNANFELGDGEWKECPIPEQFVSTFKAGVFSTTISDLYH